MNLAPHGNLRHNVVEAFLHLETHGFDEGLIRDKVIRREGKNDLNCLDAAGADSLGLLGREILDADVDKVLEQPTIH